MPMPVVPSQLATERFGERYADLIEPLFIDSELPVESAWLGHVPFLAVLLRLLQPDVYVELGVHRGLSLWAAADLAQRLELSTSLTGIDSFQGDAHTGSYDGDAMYHEVSRRMTQRFASVSLVRSLFSEARPRFPDGSIDLLHIDGLHTYDAVKEDFVTWLPAVRSRGVVLLHDIQVFDRGFGVHRLWEELKEDYATMELPHSSGLGVVFLDAGAPGLAPLHTLRADPTALRWYQSLLADVAGTLAARTRLRLRAERAERELQQTLASSSWRLTAPLRDLRKRLR